jgi:hypothetical protein
LNPWFDSRFLAAIEDTRKNSRQPSVVLVSAEQTFTTNSVIPNDGFEQMARENYGASANPNTSIARAPVMGPRA